MSKQNADITVNDKMELRTYKSEIRAATAAAGIINFNGHAAVFNTPVDIGGWFIEEIAPGAFSQAIIEDDVRALFNHDANFVLGRNIAGTLKLSEDTTGLAVSIDAPETNTAKDLKISVDRGDITQMSFGFNVLEETWNFEVEPAKRLIRKVKLFDVSIVTYPAYATTDVSARTFDAAKQAQEQQKKAEAEKTATANKNQLDLLRDRLEISKKEI